MLLNENEQKYSQNCFSAIDFLFSDSILELVQTSDSLDNFIKAANWLSYRDTIMLRSATLDSQISSQ